MKVLFATFVLLNRKEDAVTGFTVGSQSIPTLTHTKVWIQGKSSDDFLEETPSTSSVSITSPQSDQATWFAKEINIETEGQVNLSLQPPRQVVSKEREPTSEDVEQSADLTVPEEQEKVSESEPTSSDNGNVSEDMSLNEILEVVSEVEELAKESESLKKDTIAYNNPENDEKIQAFFQALGEAAKDGTQSLLNSVLSGLRRTATKTLTKSLPADERDTLLKQLREPSTNNEDDDDADRGSVAEEIAAASAAQARLYEAKWETEKEKLIKEMKEAAEARVKNELAIQRQRLKRDIDKLEASQKKLEVENETLQNQQIQDGVQEVAELKAIIEKREQQKRELAFIESDLRDRLEDIERQKALIVNGAKELGKTQESTKDGDKSKVPYYTPKEYRNLSKEEKAALKLRRAALRKDEPMEDSDEHPVLGRLIGDLGYKRVYLTPAGKLGTIPIWKKQRIYRHNRAKSMANEKVKSMKLGFPGVVCLHEDKNGKLSILDGQHRVGMMQLLRAKRNKDSKLEETDAYFDEILVEVYSVPNQEEGDNDQEHAEKVFLEINKAEPVKLVDMPGVASAKDRKVITQAIGQLQDRFPKMFSSSQRCRVYVYQKKNFICCIETMEFLMILVSLLLSPNVNVDNMRNNIYGSNVLKRHNLVNSKQLYDWLLVQNTAVGASYESDVEKKATVSRAAWKKANENLFYLGIENTWLYK